MLNNKKSMILACALNVTLLATLSAFADDQNTCPKDLSGKSTKSWNLVGGGAFAPIPQGEVITEFKPNGDMVAHYDGKTVTGGHYQYRYISSMNAEIIVTHPSGPRKGLSYTSTLDCTQHNFFATTDDQASWLSGDFSFIQ